jgi:hypothetical protein
MLIIKGLLSINPDALRNIWTTGEGSILGFTLRRKKGKGELPTTHLYLAVVPNMPQSALLKHKALPRTLCGEGKW